MKIAKGSKGNVFNIMEAENRKNTITANFSTFEGKDKEGNPVYSSWRAHFVGKAYDKAKSLVEKETIVLNDAKIENDYNKEKERLYVTLTVFDFEVDSHLAEKLGE